MGTALITGASAGLGEEFAWQLATAQHDLILVARRQERLETLAHELRQIAGVQVEVLPADLSQPDDFARVAQRLRSSERPVDLLVNNAGFGLGQSFLDGDLAREEAALAVMVHAVMVLSHAAATSMRMRGRGAILNVSSLSAHTVLGTYAAHKAWVLSFTEGLANELRGSGVTATVLCPGLVHTEFHQAAHMDLSALNSTALDSAIWLDAERVVTAALQAVRRGKVTCTPSLRYRSADVLLRLAPRPVLRQISAHLPANTKNG